MATLLDTYADLQTAIQTWLWRVGDTDLAARVPDLIELFESEFLIDPDMRTAEMSEIDTALLTSAAIPLPTGFLDMIRLKVLGSAISAPDVILDYVSPAVAGQLDASISTLSSTTSGTAKKYTVIANQIFVTPQKWAPIGATLEMAYYNFAPLSATSPSNWLLQKYPNLYLYGSLMQGAAYIDDKDTVQLWNAGLVNGKQKLAATERKRKLGASPLIVRPSASFLT